MGECRRCGLCCTFHIPVSELDISRLKAYVDSGYRFKDITEIFGAEKDIFDEQCPFLDRVTNECTAYLARPAVCQIYGCGQAGGPDRAKNIEWMAEHHDIKDRNLSRIFRPDVYELKVGSPVFAAVPTKENTDTGIEYHTVKYIGALTGFTDNGLARITTQDGLWAKVITADPEFVQVVLNPDSPLQHYANWAMESGKGV